MFFNLTWPILSNFLIHLCTVRKKIVSGGASAGSHADVVAASNDLRQRILEILGNFLKFIYSEMVTKT